MPHRYWLAAVALAGSLSSAAVASPVILAPEQALVAPRSESSFLVGAVPGPRLGEEAEPLWTGFTTSWSSRSRGPDTAADPVAFFRGALSLDTRAVSDAAWEVHGAASPILCMPGQGSMPERLSLGVRVELSPDVTGDYVLALSLRSTVDGRRIATAGVRREVPQRDPEPFAELDGQAISPLESPRGALPASLRIDLDVDAESGVIEVALTDASDPRRVLFRTAAEPADTSSPFQVELLAAGARWSDGGPKPVSAASRAAGVFDELRATPSTGACSYAADLPTLTTRLDRPVGAVRVVLPRPPTGQLDVVTAPAGTVVPLDGVTHLNAAIVEAASGELDTLYTPVSLEVLQDAFDGGLIAPGGVFEAWIPDAVLADTDGGYFVDIATRDRGAARPKTGFFVNATLQPSRSFFVAPHAWEPRPVAMVRLKEGLDAHFIENELIFVGDDPVALGDFLDRWQGEILASLDPADHGFPELPPTYLVRVDPTPADPDAMLSTLKGLEPRQQKLHSFPYAVSSEQGLRLLAASVEEYARGNLVGVSWLLEADVFEDGTTEERGLQNGGFDDAFTWTYMNSGSVQDIGVTDAWRALEVADRLDNKVDIAIFDSGFYALDGFPKLTYVPMAQPAHLNATNINIGEPDHGTLVAQVAGAVADDRVGVAGVAGPVANLLLVDTYQEPFHLSAALAVAAAGGADIFNISGHVPVPAVLDFTLLWFDAFTAVISQDVGPVVASAGNDGVNVDKTFLFVETITQVPCESASVICVGGVADNATTRHPISNYGPHDVEIFGPGDALAGPTAHRAVGLVSGTSLSTPFVAGVLALMKAAQPTIALSQLREILLATSRTNTGDAKVKRLVHARGAVREVLSPAPVFTRVFLPLEGSTHEIGEPVPFQAGAFDPQGDVVSTQWLIDGVPVSVGGVVSPNPPPMLSEPGSYMVTLRAVDSTGHVAEDAVVIHTSHAATGQVKILSPEEGAHLYAGDTFSFQGAANPSNTPVTWTLTPAGASTGQTIGSSLSFAMGSVGAPVFAPGDYALRLSSATASDAVNIRVFNQAPLVAILSPLQGSTYLAAGGISFDALAVDPEQGAGLAVQWYVDDVWVASGTSPSLTLSPGLHSVRAKAVDELGAVGADAVLVLVMGAP